MSSPTSSLSNSDSESSILDQPVLVGLPQALPTTNTFEPCRELPIHGLPVVPPRLNKRQYERASLIRDKLLFRGINEYCAKDIKDFADCKAYYKGVHPDGKLKPGECISEGEYASMCRLLAAESLLQQCQQEITGLTEAIGLKRSEPEIAMWTNLMFKCGLTPSALQKREYNRIPMSLMRAAKSRLEERDLDEKFKDVLRYQVETELQERAAIKAGVKVSSSSPSSVTVSKNTTEKENSKTKAAGKD